MHDEGTERLAKALTELEFAKRDSPVRSDDYIARDQLRKAAAPAELEYLRRVSPAAAAQWEHALSVNGQQPRDF
jgi:hypothetical protein